MRRGDCGAGTKKPASDGDAGFLIGHEWRKLSAGDVLGEDGQAGLVDLGKAALDLDHLGFGAAVA